MDLRAVTPPDPIVVTTPSGRTVTLKWLSVAGIEQLERLLKAKVSPQDFVTTVLHRHLISPQISVSELASWPSQEIQSVAKAWAAHPLGLDTQLTGEALEDFKTAAAEYVRKSTLEITSTLNRAFEGIRRQEESIRHLLGPTAAIQDALKSFSLAERTWQRTVFARLAEGIRLQQDMFASLGSVRLLEEITRTARATLATSVVIDLPGIATALQAAAAHRSILSGPLRLPAEGIHLARLLDLGIASITDSAEQVWRTWASEGEELSTVPQSLRQAPALEVYSASSVAVSIVGGEESTPPTLVANRAGALLESLPEALDRIHTELPRLLTAAAALVNSSAPDSSRHFAISLRELLTHLLHHLAPDDAIASWSERQDSDYDEGKPTRPARVRFILRAVGNTAYAPFMVDDIKRAVELLDALNRMTHNLESTSDPLARRLTLRRVHFIIGVLLDGHVAAQG
jgi:hypothetical protein